MKVWQHDPPEPLRYFVESRSEPETPHFVDLCDLFCSCGNWKFQRGDAVDKIPCLHIEAAIEHWAVETLVEIRRLTTPDHGL